MALVKGLSKDSLDFGISQLHLKLHTLRKHKGGKQPSIPKPPLIKFAENIRGQDLDLVLLLLLLAFNKHLWSPCMANHCARLFFALIWSKPKPKPCNRSSLVVLWIKDPGWSLQGLGSLPWRSFDPWPTCCGHGRKTPPPITYN